MRDVLGIKIKMIKSRSGRESGIRKNLWLNFVLKPIFSESTPKSYLSFGRPNIILFRAYC